MAAPQRDWLQVELDANTRRGLAERVEAHADPGNPELPRLVKMLRSSRDELLFDQTQAKLVLDALNDVQQLSALQARLEAFLGLR